MFNLNASYNLKRALVHQVSRNQSLDKTYSPSLLSSYQRSIALFFFPFSFFFIVIFGGRSNMAAFFSMGAFETFLSKKSCQFSRTRSFRKFRDPKFGIRRGKCVKSLDRLLISVHCFNQKENLRMLLI